MCPTIVNKEYFFVCLLTLNRAVVALYRPISVIAVKFR